MTFENITVCCPNCGEHIGLADCPVVATNFTSWQTTGPFGQNPADGQRTPASGAAVHSTIGGWPVVALAPSVTAPKEEKRRLFGARFDPLPSVHELARPEDLPARLCTRCDTPLPVDIDSRDAYTVAVVGTNGAAKTHYLASVLHEAYHLQGLRPFGCSEFAPDEYSGDRLHRDYYAPLYKKRTTLDITQPVPEKPTPMTFRATFDGDRSPFLLMFYDIAGEVLRDVRTRATLAGFVRRADAVIFLVDPVWLDPIQPDVARLMGQAIPDSLFNQADLLHSIGNEIDQRQERIPVAVTISKSDLIAASLGRSFQFSEPHTPVRAEWEHEMSTISKETVGVLEELGAHDILAAANRLESVSYHAVAAIGAPPKNNQITELRPRHCLDPLVSVLARVPGLKI